METAENIKQKIDAVMARATMGRTFKVTHTGIPLYIINDSRIVDDDPDNPFFMESWCAEFELPTEGQPGIKITRCCNERLSGLCAEIAKLIEAD